jgi:hypothetical protein
MANHFVDELNWADGQFILARHANLQIFVNGVSASGYNQEIQSKFQCSFNLKR